MKYKVGDKVRFLNDVGEGEVVKIFDENRIIVMGSDGFEIPSREKDLLLVKNFSHEYLDDGKPGAQDYESHSGRRETVQLIPDDIEEYDDLDTMEVEKDLTLIENIEASLVLGFVPTNSENILKSTIDFFLINDSNYSISYSLGVFEEKDIFRNIGFGLLEPNTKIHIGRYNQTDIAQLNQLSIQVLWFGRENYFFKNPLSEILDLSKENFYRAKEYIENDYFDEKAKIYMVGKAHLADIIKEKVKDTDFEKVIFEKDKSKQLKNQDVDVKSSVDKPEEIDLHIQEILDDYHDLSNGEIIRIQLNRFETALEGAIHSKQNKIVFIHGVGEGKLKYELRKTLDTKYPDLKYQDASFKEYGYGATMVFTK